MTRRYSEKLLDHFRNPRNVGELIDADCEGEAGNPECGDLIKLYLKISKDIISDIKFKTFGCAAAIATSSILTELALGKNLEDAFAISKIDVSESLDGLPESKMHCSNMATDALKAAINQYLSKNDRSLLVSFKQLDIS